MHQYWKKIEKQCFQMIGRIKIIKRNNKTAQICHREIRLDDEYEKTSLKIIYYFLFY